MSEDTGFGTPKHTSGKSTFPEALKDGSQEHRILPPILNQKDSGKYVQEHTCHYGYGIKLQGNDKERPNPFYCVEVGRWADGKFVVTQECPECRAIKMVKTQKERVEAQMKEESKTEGEITTAVESYTDWLRKHNRDFKQYVNVRDSTGRYFTAKYPQKSVWKVIKAFIEQYKARKVPIDAIAASQGLLFRITRSGKGFKTEYAVEVVTEEVINNGQVVEGATKYKLAPLTADDARKAQESCMDIGDVGIRRLSVEQVARLVAAKGDQAVIAAIFSASDPTKQVTQDDEREEEEDHDPLAEAGKAAPVIAPAPVVAPVTQKPTQEPAKEDLIAQARALLAKAKDLPAVVSPTATPVHAAPVVAPVIRDLTKTPAPVISPVTIDGAFVPVAPAPVSTPAPTPSATGDSAEAAFLAQFAM